MKGMLLLAVAAFLTGCASHYVEPTTGPVATVTFSASGIDHGDWILVQSFKNDGCAPSDSGTRLATFTTKAIQGKGDPHDGVARLMPAGRTAVVSYIYQSGAQGFTETKSCSITESFIPAAKEHYLVSFRKSGLVCGVLITHENGDPKAVPNLHQVKPSCFNAETG